MKYRSVFDIIGPIMVGPSSSHTAGSVRIGQLARKLLGKTPEKVTIHFYGSFAETYRGHATDVAIIAGLLGYETFDSRIPQALSLARESGLDYTFICEEAIPLHPNTVRIEARSGEDSLTVTGVSLGGGLVQITELSGFPLRLSGECPAILILHRDAYGAVAAVTNTLMFYRINISHMEVSRIEKGQTALMVIETDQKIPEDALNEINAHKHVVKVIVIDV